MKRFLIVAAAALTAALPGAAMAQAGHSYGDAHGQTLRGSSGYGADVYQGRGGYGYDARYRGSYYRGDDHGGYENNYRHTREERRERRHERRERFERRGGYRYYGY